MGERVRRWKRPATITTMDGERQGDDWCTPQHQFQAKSSWEKKRKEKQRSLWFDHHRNGDLQWSSEPSGDRRRRGESSGSHRQQQQADEEAKPCSSIPKPETLIQNQTQSAQLNLITGPLAWNWGELSLNPKLIVISKLLMLNYMFDYIYVDSWDWLCIWLLLGYELSIERVDRVDWAIWVDWIVIWGNLWDGDMRTELGLCI